MAVPQSLSPLFHRVLSRHIEGVDSLRAVGESERAPSLRKAWKTFTFEAAQELTSPAESALRLRKLTSFAIWKVGNAETSASRSVQATLRDR